MTSHSGRSPTTSGQTRPIPNKKTTPIFLSPQPPSPKQPHSKHQLQMTKIKSLEYFRVPPRWLFVKITDEEGQVGWGEASLEGHTQAVEGCLDAYRERIVGMDADEIEHIWQMIYRYGFYRGGPVLMSALSGVDIALWDLKARKLSVPIYQLLGGKVRDNLKVYAWIGGDRPDDVEKQA